MESEKVQKSVVNEENQKKVHLLLQIEYHQQRIETLHKMLEKTS